MRTPPLADDGPDPDAEYRTLVQNAADLICMHDLAGRYRYVSARVGALLGYAAEELLGRSPYELIEPGDAQDIVRPYHVALTKGDDIAHIEYRIRHRNGDYVWIETGSRPIRAANGIVTGFVSLSRGIGTRKRVEAALQDRDDQLAFALALNRIALTDFDLLTDTATFSPEYAEILGYERRRLKTNWAAWEARLHPEDRAPTLNAVRKCLNGDDTIGTLNYRQKSASGDFCWMRSAFSVFERAADGRPLRLVATHTNVTEQMRSQELLDLAARVFEQSQEGILVADVEARIVYVNPAFSRITGYASDEVRGRNPRILSSGKHDRSFYADLWGQLEAHGQWQGEIWNRRRNGEIYPEWLKMSALQDRHGRTTHYVATFSDLSERKSSEEHIRRLSLYDPVTGLPNWNELSRLGALAVSAALRDGSRVALLLIGLDRFKSINESLGHAIGDALLKKVAERLMQYRHGSDVLARLGGDEFAFLLTHVEDEAQASTLCDRLLEHCQYRTRIGDEWVAVAFSIGVALTPEAGSDFAALLRNSDVALGEAKATGRGTWRLADANLTQRRLQRLRLEAALHRAVDDSAFVLHFQPVVDLDTAQVSGAEALLRWQDDSRGLVPPGDFIPLAEETGLIRRIGGWVLDAACCAFAALNARLAPERRLYVAVNVSASQIDQGLLETQVEQALELSGLAPNLLMLELTESAFIRDADEIVATLARLAARGVRLAVDDFGTGYSSFTYLRHFQIDTLKIDQSFVRKMLSEPDDEVIVKTMVDMARNLSIRSLAEGVENAAVSLRLTELGCDAGQGFHYARPMPIDELAQFVATTRSAPALSSARNAALNEA